jgi:hypothetical protein
MLEIDENLRSHFFLSNFKKVVFESPESKMTESGFGKFLKKIFLLKKH